MNFYKLSRPCFSRSYCNRHSKDEFSKPRLISEKSYVAFKKSWPKILDNTFTKNSLPDEAKTRLKMIADYTFSGGSKIRPTLALLAFDTLGKGNYSEDTLNAMRVLALGSEMVHTYLIILNDSTDYADDRPCWHALPNVERQSINDATLLRSLVSCILKDNFGEKLSYLDLKHLFENAFFYTDIGLHLDRPITRENNKKFQTFTMDHYDTIIHHKTTYNTFKLPIFLAMKLAEKTDEKSYSCVENVCKDMGKLFQMQNDYKDSFMENYGSSIPNGKHSWFAVAALQRCNAAQRIAFTSCYGSREPAHIERIQQLYIKLQLPQLYQEEKRKIIDEIRYKAQHFSTGTAFEPELFLKLLEEIKID